jgi:hypothetical protein
MGERMIYIDRIEVQDTGGGLLMDMVILKNGVCIGVSDECCVIYPTYDHYLEAMPDERVQAYMFNPEEQM